MKICAFIILLTAGLALKTFSQPLTSSWVKSFGGSKDDYNSDVAFDSNGNIYQTVFTSSPSISIDSYTLDSASSVIIKYDVLGNVIWVRDLGPTLVNISKKVFDAQDNFYVVGSFRNNGPLIIDQDTIYNSTSTSIWKNFIAKFNANNELIFADSFYESDSLGLVSIAVDQDFSIYLSGKFFSNQIIIGQDTLDSNPAYPASTAFIMKTDSARNPMWAKYFSADEYAVPLYMCVTTNGSINIVGGFYSNYLKFDADSVMNTSSSSDVFVMQIDSSGTLTWLKSFGSINNDWVADFDINRSRQLFLTGYYSADLHIDSAVLNSNGLNDTYLISFTDEGNLRWSFSVGASDEEAGTSVASDTYGNIFLAGTFRSDSIVINNTIYYNPGHNSTLDYFFVKLDSLGGIVWSNSLSTDQLEVSPMLDLDGQNNLYLSGSFRDSLIDIGGIITYNQPGSQYFDFFISKIDVPLALTDVTFPKISYYPNPVFEDLTIKLNLDNNDCLTYEVFDMQGRSVSKNSTLSIAPNLFRIHLKEIETGAYVLVLETKNFSQPIKIIKQ